MPLILGSQVLDAGLASLDTEATHIYVCSAQPTTYAEATTGFALGVKNFGAGSVFGAPYTASSPDVDGRLIDSFAVTDGSITASGTVLYWAIVDASNLRLLATGPLSPTGSPAGADVLSGQLWTMDSFTILMPGVAVVEEGEGDILTGLVHHWPMDDANVAGTQITNVVNGSFHMTAFSGGETTSTGPGGTGPATARAIDGSAYMNGVGALYDWNGDAHTVAGYAFLTNNAALGSLSANQRLFSCDEDGDGVTNFLIIRNNAATPGGVVVDLADGTVGRMIVNSEQIPSGAWVHIAYTNDTGGVGGTRKIYVDRSLVGHTTGVPGGGPGVQAFFCATSDGGFGTITGRVCGWRIYNRALTATDVAALP